MFKIYFKKFFRQGLLSQSIWFDDLYSCSSSDRCLTSCQACPTRENHNCVHSEDVTLQCGTKLITKIGVLKYLIGRGVGQCLKA